MFLFLCVILLVDDLTCGFTAVAQFEDLAWDKCPAQCSLGMNAGLAFLLTVLGERGLGLLETAALRNLCD